MSEAKAPVRPGWTRRVAGSSVILFILLSGGLWLACLFAWQLRQPELVVAFLGLGAFAPVLWLGVRLRTQPIWALLVPEGRVRLVDLLRGALRDRLPTSVASETAGHGGLFRGCETLLRIEDPACLLGVRRSPGDPWTTVLLLPESKDRAALDRLRASIEERVAHG